MKNPSILFSIFLISPDTFLHVLFKKAMANGLAVKLSVYLEYFLANSSADMLFTKMPCLRLCSFSLSLSLSPHLYAISFISSVIFDVQEYYQ